LNTPIIANQKDNILRSMEFDDFIATIRNRPSQEK